jgi:predicted  nucleic acid-binding Zn-ribbon protein
MTQKEVLDAVLSEIRHIKTHMPNGELKQMQKDMESLKEDMSDMKFTLLNPDNGVIVNTNKNTEFRLQKEAREREYAKHIQDLEEIKVWKSGVTRALWVIFGILASVIIRMLMMHSDKIQ